ncbi:MAG: hypothetical protein IPJ07_02345 [Acidobacteria bacterium]|nr:hypothetical protein [Acidobacteriota bacterium]
MVSFNIARLINIQTIAKIDAAEQLADQVFPFAQRAINNNPLEDPQSAIGLDETVRSLIKASTGEGKDFIYCTMISTDGAIIAQSDPSKSLQSISRLKQMDVFQTTRWYKQLWELWRYDNIYELSSTLSLNKKPFARVVVGVPSKQLRSKISPAIKLSGIFGLIMVVLCCLTAVLSSNLVLWPLREVMESVEQLEVESALHTEARPVNVEMQSIASRLRELGRRFAGNRTEIEAIRDQLQQVVGSLTERVLLLDRERRPVNGSQQPQAIVASLQLFEDRGQPAGALLTLRDFETLQRLETQLDFATKLAALNRITAGVAHEVKNPLHAMVLHLELLGAKLEAGLDPKPHVDILMSEVNRLKRVVQTFLDFTRPVELKLTQVDANVLVREVILLAADARAQGIDLEEHYGKGPLIIKADSDLLKQALLNIIINGCQVMPSGGRLVVETGRDEDSHIFISITDHGPGIPEDSRDKIFNLYYTTKPKGSGIGLAQAFRAVQLHNGKIKVESEVGAGTCFRIILPVG